MVERELASAYPDESQTVKIRPHQQTKRENRWRSFLISLTAHPSLKSAIPQFLPALRQRVSQIRRPRQPAQPHRSRGAPQQRSDEDQVCYYCAGILVRLLDDYLCDGVPRRRKQTVYVGPSRQQSTNAGGVRSFLQRSACGGVSSTMTTWSQNHHQSMMSWLCPLAPKSHAMMMKNKKVRLMTMARLLVRRRHRQGRQETKRSLPRTAPRH